MAGVIREELAKLNLREEASAQALLTVEVHASGGEVTSSQGGSTLPYSTVWAKATLRAPVTVARAETFAHVLATVAATVYAVPSVSAKVDPESVQLCLREVINSLPGEADSRNDDILEESVWRAYLLTSSPHVSRLYAEWQASSRRNAGGLRTSLEGITSLGRLDTGEGYMNRSAYVRRSGPDFHGGLDLSGVWESAQGVSPVRFTATITSSVPLAVRTHHLNGFPVNLPSIRGQSALLALIDQAAIVEENCFISLDGKPFRLACLAAEAASVGHAANELQVSRVLREQTSRTVLTLLRQLRPPSSRAE